MCGAYPMDAGAQNEGIDPVKRVPGLVEYAGYILFGGYVTAQPGLGTFACNRFVKVGGGNQSAFIDKPFRHSQSNAPSGARYED